MASTNDWHQRALSGGFLPRVGDAKWPLPAAFLLMVSVSVLAWAAIIAASAIWL